MVGLHCKFPRTSLCTQVALERKGKFDAFLDIAFGAGVVQRRSHYFCSSFPWDERILASQLCAWTHLAIKVSSVNASQTSLKGDPILLEIRAFYSPTNQVNCKI